MRNEQLREKWYEQIAPIKQSPSIRHVHIQWLHDK